MTVKQEFSESPFVSRSEWNFWLWEMMVLEPGISFWEILRELSVMSMMTETFELSKKTLTAQIMNQFQLLSHYLLSLTGSKSKCKKNYE